MRVDVRIGTRIGVTRVTRVPSSSVCVYVVPRAVLLVENGNRGLRKEKEVEFGTLIFVL